MAVAMDAGGMEERPERLSVAKNVPERKAVVRFTHSLKGLRPRSLFAFLASSILFFGFFRESCEEGLNDRVQI